MDEWMPSDEIVFAGVMIDDQAGAKAMLLPESGIPMHYWWVERVEASCVFIRGFGSEPQWTLRPLGWFLQVVEVRE